MAFLVIAARPEEVSEAFMDIVGRIKRAQLFSPRLIVIALLFFMQCVADVGGQYFPFVIPGDDATPSIVDRSVLLGGPAGRDGFVTRHGRHFSTGGKRIRFWGVNVCFGANFPTHDESDRIAPHLAKLGINAVRFHHMDSQQSPNGIWGLRDADGRLQFDPVMVDRLDYFLAQLHAKGIYADFGLHTSRTLRAADGFPEYAAPQWWASSNKWVMYYDEEVQRELKRISREFLLHENPYRNGMRRVDDPGIALLEMMNENYFSKQGFELYWRLPVPFQRSFQSKWNTWLKAKYATTEALKTSWQANEKGLGPHLVERESFRKGLGRMELTRDEEQLPRMFDRPPPPELADHDAELRALRVVPAKTAEHDYDYQLRVGGLAASARQPLTCSFWVRADAPRTVKLEFSSVSGGEWRSLGIMETLNVSEQWTFVERIITPEESVPNEAFLALSFGDLPIPLEFAGLSLQEGTPFRTLAESQTLEANSIAIPDAQMPTAAHQDMREFLVDTERDWIRQFKEFLVDELQVKIPITATQLNYLDPHVVAETCDYADLHNYWHHPLFPPGRDWNPEQWTVGNEPMEAYPFRAGWPTNGLLPRAGWRPRGMPMVMTEWNYCEPSRYAAGCVPMAAVVACLQDWDAIFFFDYESFWEDDPQRRPFFRDATGDFFGFNGAPNKLAALSICANLFLRQDLEPLSEEIVTPVDSPAEGQLAFAAQLFADVHQTARSPQTIPQNSPLQTPNQSVIWHNGDTEKAHLVLRTARTKGAWGMIAGQTFAIPGLHMSVGEIPSKYGILLLTSQSEAPLESTDRMVFLAATHSENQGMQWNVDKTSVGTGWGEGPTQVAAIEAKISLRTSRTQAKVFALNGKGEPSREVPAMLEDGMLTFSIGKEYQSIWYGIELNQEGR